MDSVTAIALVSIIVAGLTMAIGSLTPALGESRGLSSALTSIAQQPDEAKNIA